MGKLALSGRDNWETVSGKKALGAEQDLYEVLNKAFEGTKYKLHEKPKHLKRFSHVKNDFTQIIKLLVDSDTRF